MGLVVAIIKLLGGLSIFMLGLKLIADNFSFCLNDKSKQKLQNITKNKFGCVIIGGVLSGLTQSSVGINMATLSLIKEGVLSLTSASAIIIGTNIGTTMTAQIVSLTFTKGINIDVIGYLLLFIGFIFYSKNKCECVFVGKIILGFGLIIKGIELLTNSSSLFFNYDIFKAFFCVKNSFLLLLNGFVITAVFQSSSVITSMLVILSYQGHITFDSVVYLIVGANIGSTMAVIYASKNMDKNSKIIGLFNLFFNLISGVIFVIINLLTNGIILNVIKGHNISSRVANFHTLFNLFFGLIFLPIIKYVVKLCQIIVENKKVTKAPKYAKNIKNFG